MTEEEVGSVESVTEIPEIVAREAEEAESAGVAIEKAGTQPEFGNPAPLDPDSAGDGVPELQGSPWR